MPQWRKAYEHAAEEEASRWRQAPDRELLEAIRSGRTGSYFSVWREVARRPRSPQVCWLLFDVLLSQREYLERYHCADALLQLLGCNEFEAVELSAPWPAVPANLERMRAVVTEAVGRAI